MDTPCKKLLKNQRPQKNYNCPISMVVFYARCVVDISKLPTTKYHQVSKIIITKGSPVRVSNRKVEACVCILLTVFVIRSRSPLHISKPLGVIRLGCYSVSYKSFYPNLFRFILNRIADFHRFQ